MATKCREAKTRYRARVMQTYLGVITMTGIALAGGIVVGRDTAPKTVITETVEVPSYTEDTLPEVTDVQFFDVPLSHSLQRYIYEVCADEEVPVSLVMAMIDVESDFNPEAKSPSCDYGLMQINEVNEEQLAEKYRASDLLNPYQNVFCGIKIIGSYIDTYDDYNRALMAYNMGEYGARKAWENGINETEYSKNVLACMDEYGRMQNA